MAENLVIGGGVFGTGVALEIAREPKHRGAYWKQSFALDQEYL